jgi:phosphatidylinositol glycan class U
MSRDRGAFAVATLAMLARVALAWYGWAETLAGRVELTSPADSVLRLREGQALAALDQSPYAGSMLHAPPLALLLLGPLTRDAPAGLPAVAPFLVADALTAIALFALAARVARASDALEATPGDGSSANPAPAPASSSGPARPAAVAAAYLANPMTVASCVACSTAGMKHLALVAACVAAVDGEVALAGAAFAAFAYLAGPPAALIFPPVALLLARGGVGGYDARRDDSRVHRDDVRASRRDSNPRASHLHAALHAHLHLGAWTTAWFLALVAASTAAYADVGARTLEWMDATYGFLLRAEDLTPNLGLHWYFFAEMFDDFRAFFLCAFAGFGAFLVLPAVVRMGRDRPLFCVFVAKLCATATAPYPTLGDVAGHLAMLPLFAEPLRRYRGGFLVAAAYAFVGILAPIFWRLWIESRVANANFFFAVTLAHVAAHATLCVGCAREVLAHDRRRKRRETADVGRGGGRGRAKKAD